MGRVDDQINVVRVLCGYNSGHMVVTTVIMFFKITMTVVTRKAV